MESKGGKTLNQKQKKETHNKKSQRGIFEAVSNHGLFANAEIVFHEFASLNEEGIKLLV